METKNHYSDPLTTHADGNAGASRKAGDASREVKQHVAEAIGKNVGVFKLSERDHANLLALAKLESGFNPDAAARPNHTSHETSASGVFQITDETKDDAIKRLSGTERINHVDLGPYDRFDVDSNVKYGTAIYMDKKRRAGGTEDIAEIYKKYNTSPGEFNKWNPMLRADSDRFYDQIVNDKPIELPPSPGVRAVPAPPGERQPPARAAESLDAINKLVRDAGYGARPAAVEQGRNDGKILLESANHFAQDTGRKVATIHDKANFDEVALRDAMETGGSLRIQYDQGRASVESKQDRSQSMER